MSAHTPGPWEVCMTYVRTRFDINEGGGTAIAQIDTITAESEANARLIAAAPELLAVLDEIVNYNGGAESALNDEYVMDRARAAIAKATGE